MIEREPSIVHAPIRAPLSIGEVRERLRARGYEADCGPCSGPRWQLTVRSEREGREPAQFRVSLQTLPQLPVPIHPEPELQDALAQAAGCETSLVVETTFGDRPLWDFHRQLQLLAAAAPDPVLVVDTARFVAHLPTWLTEVTEATTPPSPRSLYTVHAVGNDGLAWIHTHGLRRCGSQELELVDVPAAELSRVDPLVHTIACQWIESGPPDEGEVFEAGKGMSVVWQPWQKAVADIRGPGDADDRDEYHSGPSGVVYASIKSWTGRKLGCPSQMPGLRCAHPMLFLSTMETNRQALLAAERLPRFFALRPRCEALFGEETRFLVKLGYPVDGESDPDNREHLWFEVHGRVGDEVDATLLNAPYGVAHLQAGDRGLHALEKLSDWAILTPAGQFGPDRVFELEADLSAAH